MGYVKWVANQDRHNDWTEELIREDGTVIKQGVPINLNASQQKELEDEGRIFVDSSADEAKELATGSGVQVGADTAVSGPVFNTAPPEVAPEPESAPKTTNDKK